MSKRTTNDGSEFERLVKILEGLSLPPGYELVDRLTTYVNGTQTGEFDLVHKIKVGSFTFQYLVECRDRKTLGDVPWIEQLAGRKRRMNFDRVIAASKLGFTASAREIASSCGIDLRQMDEITAADLSGWLTITGLDWISDVYTLEQANYGISTDVSPELTAKAVEAIASGKAPKLFFEAIDDPITAEELFRQCGEQKLSLLDGMKNGERRDLKLSCDFKDDIPQLKMKLEDGSAIRVVQMQFAGYVLRSMEVKPMTAIKSYVISDGAQLGHAVTFAPIPSGDGELITELHHDLSSRRTSLTVSKRATTDTSSII